MLSQPTLKSSADLIAFKILHSRTIRGYSTAENGWMPNSVRLLEKYQLQNKEFI
jgi:hypothetical protein